MIAYSDFRVDGSYRLDTDFGSWRRRPVKGLAVQVACEDAAAHRIRHRYRLTAATTYFTVGALREVDDMVGLGYTADAPVSALAFLTLRSTESLRDHLVFKFKYCPTSGDEFRNANDTPPYCPTRGDRTLSTIAGALDVLVGIETGWMRLAWLRARARTVCGLADLPGLSGLDAGHERLGA